MSTIVIWLKKSWLVVVIVALCFTSVPLASVYALVPPDPITAPVPTQKVPARLEQIWAKEQAIHSKLGTFLNNIDGRIVRWQELINKARASGKDTSTLQTALDTFSVAVKQAKPIYQSTDGIVSSHLGFDESGKVIDQVQAIVTVISLGRKYKEIWQHLLGPGKALRGAVKAFRNANAPTATPTPSQTGS